MLSDLQLPVQPREEEKLFAHLDREKSGRVDYEEFLEAVRGPMSDRRLALVDRVFDSLDREGRGYLDATDMALRFDASRHPEARRGGAQKPMDLMKNFLKSFDFGGAQPLGRVSREIFRRYYRGLSAGFQDDKAFEQMLLGVWRLKG